MLCISGTASVIHKVNPASCESPVCRDKIDTATWCWSTEVAWQTCDVKECPQRVVVPFQQQMTLAWDPKPESSYETGSDGDAGRRGPFSLKTWFFIRFGPQEWSGWIRTGRRINLVFVSGQTVDSGTDSNHFR